MGSGKKSEKDTGKSGSKTSKPTKGGNEPVTFAATNPTAPSRPDQ